MCLWYAPQFICFSKPRIIKVPLQSQTTARKSEPDARAPRSLKRKKPVYAESSSSDDDVPLASSPAKPSTANGKTKAPKKEDSEDGGSDVASNKKRGKAPARKQPPKKKVKDETPSEPPSSDDEDAPLAKAPARKRKAQVKNESDSDASPPAKKPPAKSRKKVKQEDAGSDTKPPKRQRTKAVKDAPESPQKGKKGKQKEKEEDGEEVFKWWEAGDVNGDGSQKWATLEHNGVYFPPPYDPLPKNVRMKYNGQTSRFLTMALVPHYLQGNLSIYCPKPKKSLASMALFWRLITRRMLSSTRISSTTSKKSWRNMNLYVVFLLNHSTPS
jgi:DNA topoisomerase I